MHTGITYLLTALHILNTFEIKTNFKSLRTKAKIIPKTRGRIVISLAHKDVVGNKSKRKRKRQGKIT